MSLTPRDLDFMEARHAAAREIALAIGVPPMLLGIPGDNTYANYAEANRAFWRQTVLPLVNRMARALTLWLTPAYAADLRFEPDLDKIEALAPERDALWKRLEATSFLTDDEKRAAAGYDAKTEGGDSATGPFARKYREDQARDDQGRWVEEGDSGEPQDTEEVTEIEFEPTAGRGRGKQPTPVPPPPKPGDTQPQHRTPRSDRSGKEAATDVPSWARGERPFVGENGDAFAKRMMDQKYGAGNYKTGPDTEFSKIKKFGDRAFD